MFDLSPSRVHLWNRSFDDSFDRIFNTWPFHFLSEDFQAPCWKENEKSYEIAFDVPGLEKKDLKILSEGNALSIKAEWEVLGRKYHINKLIRFSGVNAEKTTAKLENGILIITIPKESFTSKQKLIDVK